MRGQTGINPGCSRTKQLGQDSAGEVRKAGIIGQDHKRKKYFSKREGPTGQAGGEPSWDLKKKMSG